MLRIYYLNKHRHRIVNYGYYPCRGDFNLLIANPCPACSSPLSTPESLREIF
ncbi:MAG: hypothetical protein F6K65_13705 [Moorea sp. SIO3C2]|nr:hypothetical protein [Moorena sp. SIO3C2]